MLFYYNECNMMDATGRAGTSYPSGAPEFTPICSVVRVAQSLVFCVLFSQIIVYRSFWPLYCLSFFNLRLLIAPLLSSSFSFLMLSQKIFQYRACRISLMEENSITTEVTDVPQVINKHQHMKFVSSSPRHGLKSHSQL